MASCQLPLLKNEIPCNPRNPKNPKNHLLFFMMIELFGVQSKGNGIIQINETSYIAASFWVSITLIISNKNSMATTGLFF
jgi:hypothetical protein